MHDFIFITVVAFDFQISEVSIYSDNNEVNWHLTTARHMQFLTLLLVNFRRSRAKLQAASSAI